ncbi:Cytochrome c biogenesis ATP-binding export protein CcmA [Blastochloris viridis]|uniref:Cytochrome c biogenesis ATP-binding export protein CcmA n=2 Tax=Blastochloris viridis TaxID=1079 RepID=A0A0S4Q6Y0_BLAVI|nr:Cytochrome c biogenesis ATP-binding export protein CcmA [Blastochloris viridis]
MLVFSRPVSPVSLVMPSQQRLVGERLICERGGREVFRDLSFSLAAGRALALVGPNGAGKSSLLRLTAGLVRPVSGTLELKGFDPELTVAEQAHYLGHLDALKPALTVAENLDFWIRALGGGPGVALGVALDQVGLARLAELPAQYLSAGQRRRLALARLLVVHRPLWLLDEPTTALDVAAQARLFELIAGHLAAGGLVMAATHQPLAVTTDELKLAGEAVQ